VPDPRRSRGVEGEHEALTTEHDVVRPVGLIDLLEVEHERAHVQDHARRGAVRRDRGHLLGDVGQHDLSVRADARRRAQAGAAGAARELEHPVAGPDRGSVEQLLRDRGAALVRVARMLAPGAGDRRPHPVQVRPHVRFARCAGWGTGLNRLGGHVSASRAFNYSC
jgi:hypothetical protein